jgi:hypothetical protein
VREPPQAIPHQHAVLSLERHQVRHRRQRHQIQVVQQESVVGIELPTDQLAQLVGQSGAAETLLGVRAVGPIRVDDRDGAGELTGHRVVVGDHHVDASGLRLGDGLVGHRAAVGGHDEGRTDLLGAGQARRPEIVAVPQAMGHEGLDVTTQVSEPPGEQRGGADPVDVVVAVHQHSLAGSDRIGDPGGCVRTARQFGRIVQVAQLGPQEALRVVGIGAGPHREHRTDRRRQPERALERSHHRWIGADRLDPLGLRWPQAAVLHAR